jgi:class 3 adenylate cyclase/tetratricopeptide (TPR) repeat protein
MTSPETSVETRRLPTGTVTFLFTDVAGSTTLWELAPEAMRRAMVRLDQLIENTVEQFGGQLVKVRGEGDSHFGVFARASDAVAAGMAFARALLAEDWPTPTPVRVRTALHTGEADLREGDYYGSAVNRCARLRSIAHPGQVLLSQATTDLVRDSLPAGARLVDLGSHRLKDLTGPERVYQLGHGELPEQFPPLRSVEARPEGLPAGADIDFPPDLDPPGAVPYVGRSGELERLAQRWARAQDGRTQLVVVEGEPGIGKTRLAGEFARLVHADGATVLLGRCDEEALRPYQAVAEALGHYVRLARDADLADRLGRLTGELARLVPDLGPQHLGREDSLNMTADVERFHLFEAVGAFFSEVTRRCPALLVVDDLHWADSATLLLLRHLVRRGEPTAFLILATSRVGAASGPAGDLLIEATRCNVLDRVRLRGLSDTEVKALLDATASPQADAQSAALARTLCLETEGNPFFIAEMVRHLAETGAIHERRGRWLSDLRIEDLGLPDQVHDVIGQRLSRLSETANKVLSTAAVVGREFRMDVLEELLDLEEDPLLDALEEAEAAGVITEAKDQPGRFSFSHALVRESLWGRLSATRRTRVHHRIGEALERLHAGSVELYLGELAYHFGHAARSGDTAKAVDYARRAGHQAMTKLAYEEAISFYTQALELLDAGDSGDLPARAELLLSLGIAQRRAGDAAYRQVILDAARLADELDDADLLARAALANSRGFFSAIGRVDTDRVTTLEHALRAVGDGDRSVRARLLANLAAEQTFGEDHQGRQALSDEAVAIARRLGDRATLAHALSQRITAIWRPDTLAERFANTAELVAVAESLGESQFLFFGRWCRSAACLEAGDVDEAVRQLDEARHLAAETGQYIPAWMGTFTYAGHELLRGSVQAAENLAFESLELGERAGYPDAVFIYGSLLWLIRREQGRLAEVEEVIRTTADNQSQSIFSAIYADVCCELNRDDEARALLADLTAADCRDWPQDLLWTSRAWCCVNAATHLAETRAAALLYDLMAPYEGHVVYQGLACMDTVANCLGRLTATLDRYDEAERHFGMAAEHETRIGAPVLLAHTKLAWAHMLIRRADVGDKERARHLLRQVLAAAEEIGVDAVAARARQLLA